MKKEFVETIRQKFKESRLVVASAREPYSHQYKGEEIFIQKNSGGVVTALDPLLKSLNGTWVAFASGNADKECLNEKNEFAVNSIDGSYTLKRVFLSKKTESLYLSSCNAAIWPLSHMVYVRPRFIDEEWEAFKQANKQFASSLAEACNDGDVVWINDYQLAMVSHYLKKLKPRVSTAFFWHIPWPSSRVFLILPWAKEFLEAMLSHDVIGFHTNYYVNNFLNTIDASLEARVDRPASKVFFKGDQTDVSTNPISVDFEGIRKKAREMPPEFVSTVLKKFGVSKGTYAIGVDRMDYTKGLKEKILAIGTLLKQHPNRVGNFTLLQIASPTRLHIPEYQQAAEDVENTAEEINWQYATGKWKPIILVDDFVDYDEIIALYSQASLCVVTALHDGMNLVCKEYVSAASDGSLILSKFAGASLELNSAYKVNPYSLSSIAGGIEKALTLDKDERISRLKKLQEEVKTNDVFDWASRFLIQVNDHLRRRH